MIARTQPATSPLGGALPVAAAGLAALAIAMGIGRFSFTPVFPLMQRDLGLDVRAGAWLAMANYAGYFVASLVAIWLRTPVIATVAVSLAGIAAATALMAATSQFALWVVLRFGAGVASAFVLVNVSAWSLEQLARHGEGRLRGLVFSGVGVGIAACGLVCWAISAIPAGSHAAWVALGLASLPVGIAVFAIMVAAPATSNHGRFERIRSNREFWRLVLCYGAFGFAYIVPATFLPVIAKSVLHGPVAFQWVWPVFGAAAAVSTVLAAGAFAAMPPRVVWRASNVVMAAGLCAAVVSDGAIGVAAAAVCVGGTFMVITMTGMQEARRVGVHHAQAFMAAMTTAFAGGQILGPLVIGLVPQSAHPFKASMAAAAALLLVAAWALGPGIRRTD